MSDERCGSCGAEVPFLTNPVAQQPQRQAPSRFSGIALVTVSLQQTLNEPVLVWGSPFYGFTVLSFSSDPTQCDLFIGKPQKKADGTYNDPLPGTIRGLRYSSPDMNPVADSLYMVKTGSSENRTVTIAIATRPGSLQSFNPVYLTDNNGLNAHVSNADADADYLDTLRGLLVNTRPSHLNGNTWNRSQGGTGDADTDFAGALSFPGSNSRLAIFQSGGDWTRWQGQTPGSTHGESSTALPWARVNSALFGRDTSDSTMRAIEARTGTGSVPDAVYRLIVGAHLWYRDIGSAASLQVLGDVLSAIAASGRATSSVAGPFIHAVQGKVDVPGAVMIPTAMSRTATGSQVAPAGAGLVILTLDCRSHPFKNAMLSSTGAGDTVDVQISDDGATWMTLAVAVPVGAAGAWLPALVSAVLMEQARAFRHMRILTGGASANTISARASAMGG